MKPPRNDLSRRRVLGWLGASAVGWVGGSAVHPLVPLQPGETWRPRFFDVEQANRVSLLAETILPETDTPGAAAALVHQYIDWRLSEATEETQQQFLRGLDEIERVSRDRHDRAFAELSSRARHELLADLAEMAEQPSARAGSTTSWSEAAIGFFRELKIRTIEGYYRSEVGMRQELGFRGNAYLREFRGCEHPEHLDWEPGGGDPGRGR